LASGLEGHVVFDLRDVTSVDKTGAERWKQLLDALTGVSSITVTHIPVPLLPNVADGSFDIARTHLQSILVEHACAGCGHRFFVALSAPSDAPAECPKCGADAWRVTDRRLIDGVIARATRVQHPPRAVDDVIARRDELLAGARREEEGPKPAAPSSRYRVIKQLSQGAMAEVLIAVQQGIGGFEKLVALKKIRKSLLAAHEVAVDYFLNEAKVAANLNHPNIVQIFELGEHAGDLIIAMEYVHGVDLRAVMERSARTPRLSLDQILFIGKLVAGALHHAYHATDLSGRQLKIVHRDVSPSNIVIAYSGEVKLVDFGIAVTPHGRAPAGKSTIGKALYMSPEQLRGEPLDGRSDLFSLGVVLYELILGRPLFQPTTDRTKGGAVQLPSLKAQGVPEGVEAILRRAVAPDRAQRYADGRSFQLALEQWLQERRSTVNEGQLANLMSQLFGDAPSPLPAAHVGDERDYLELAVLPALLDAAAAAAAARAPAAPGVAPEAKAPPGPHPRSGTPAPFAPESRGAGMPRPGLAAFKWSALIVLIVALVFAAYELGRLH
jgi:tRNA A-37 threonylcarbamoyl transferase component Bud32